MIDFTVRIGIFLTLLSVLLLWQWLRPRRPLTHTPQRWSHNAGLMAIDALCVRLVQPLLLAIVALLSTGFGVFHWLALPYWLTFVFSLILLDVTIYWQHRLFHRIPLFWRIHKVHHSDPELDVSSAVRFHPIEILFSLAIKATIIWLFGIPIEAVLAFDILLNGCAMFNHTNTRLPHYIEPWLRTILITPDMHRIHHSQRPQEAHSNFGFCLSLWDTLFHSKTQQAQGGDDQLQIGLPHHADSQPSFVNGAPSFKTLLTMPFAPTLSNISKTPKKPHNTTNQTDN